jgi:hypothetical protein
MNVAMTGVSFSTIVMKASYIVLNPINYTARTVCPSLREPNRAEWRATTLFFSANEKPNYYSISSAPPPTQVSPIAQGS